MWQIKQSIIDSYIRLQRSSQTDTRIELYEHLDWYLLCAEMHIWQEALTVFNLWLSIKSKKICIWNQLILTFLIIYLG